MGECSHKNVRFLQCKTADRMPGVFVCDDCNAKFAKNPNDTKGVRYLETPNEKFNKPYPFSSG